MKASCWVVGMVALLSGSLMAAPATSLVCDLSITSVSPPIMNVLLFCTLPSAPTGPLALVFPPGGPRGRMLSAYCTNLSATGPPGQALDATLTTEIGGVRIDHAPRQFTLSYSVLLYHGWSPYSGMSPAEAPVLGASGGVFPVRVLLILPEGDPHPTVTLRLHPGAGWNAVAPWEMKRKGDAFEATLPYDQVADSFFYLGPETGVTSRLGEGEVTVVAAAELPNVSSQQLVEWTRRIVEEQHKVFCGASAPRLTVYISCAPHAPGMFAAVGKDSVHVVLPAVGNAPSISRSLLLRGIARGLIPLWVGGASSGSGDVPLLFFENGLAEYTATVALLEGGLLSEDDFIAYLTWTLEDYLNNPLVSEIPALEGVRSPVLVGAPQGLLQFANLLSRTGGNLAGFLADSQLLEQSRYKENLAKFWAAQRKRIAAKPAYGRDEFAGAWKDVSSSTDPMQVFQRASVDLLPALRAAGVEVVASTIDEPFMGVYFDTRSATAEIKSVMEGPAKAAGLVRGDVIVTCKGLTLYDANVFFAQLRNSKPGDVLPLRIRGPDGTERDVKLRLEAKTMRRLTRTAHPTPEQTKLWHALVRAKEK